MQRKKKDKIDAQTQKDKQIEKIGARINEGRGKKEEYTFNMSSVKCFLAKNKTSDDREWSNRSKTSRRFQGRNSRSRRSRREDDRKIMTKAHEDFEPLKKID